MRLNLLFLCKICSSKFSHGSLSCSVKRLKSSIVSERETFPPPPSVGVASVLVLVVQAFMLLVQNLYFSFEFKADQDLTLLL